jgi:uncharacterized protein YjbJ (UPF0337 family)/ElaB/YqjD/DUF883 family membrane-anchored ribosome-binding protein
MVMNKESIEGGLRKTAGRMEEFAGRSTKNKQMAGEGLYDQAAGSAQSAYGHAKDAMAAGVSAAAEGARDAMDGIGKTDFDALQTEVTKLTQTVAQLLHSQAASTREQVMSAVGTAGDNITQAAASAQDGLVSFEADVEARIQKNPLAAVAIALGVGVLIGKMM